ncbi:MAG: hypothetical protein HY299_02885 [Verrucomicrobia bacterium]|nr:hypothetical protein [Verrucomicrobiota bacterium]
MHSRNFARVVALLTLAFLPAVRAATSDGARRELYVAVPGIRDYLQYGGHGVLVFDIDHGHRFLRRIPAGGVGKDGTPMNVKGVCACAATERLYVSTLETLQCFDLRTQRALWEKRYEGGCDRMSITPDGRKLFTPSLEKDFWRVIDGSTGDVISRIPHEKNAHNTIVSLDGREAYLADRGSRIVKIVDTASDQVIRTAGPFGNFVRPFTINGKHTLGYMNVDDLLGFEIADLRSGKVLSRITVTGFEKGPVAKHGCPSHGIGLTPNEKQIWVTDAHNKRLHVFDNTQTPPKQLRDIALRDEPGWITFSRDGRYAYPSTGEVIDVPSRRIIATLKDEHGADVQSEKLLEVDFEASGKVIAVGDQFGLGRVR